jgi:hypothetical protein
LGGCAGAVEVIQTEQLGRFFKWIWPLQGHLSPHSPLAALSHLQVRQNGIHRRVVELVMMGKFETNFIALDKAMLVSVWNKLKKSFENRFTSSHTLCRLLAIGHFY